MGHLSIQDSQLGPSGVLYRELPLYNEHTMEHCTQWPHAVLEGTRGAKNT